MIVLVANLGSTSFKYKLFDIAATPAAPRVLAAGAADRIGQGRSAWELEVSRIGGEAGEETGGSPQAHAGEAALADHGAAIDLHLGKLAELGALEHEAAVEAIGFKAVHGGPICGAVEVDDSVIETMEAFADVAPQHNPPYVAAMRAFAERLPEARQVAAFETGFHQTIPLARQVYGIPHAWIERYGIRRYGFHGASHRYIATRLAEIEPAATRIVSCHLGGSCSVSGIAGGESCYNSFGMTAQSGVFHASRVGDFDLFAIHKLLGGGLTLQSVLETLGSEAGLKGLSGVSADLREVKAAAEGGHAQAKLAIEAFIEHGRREMGAALMALGGVDAVVLTGGIGQHEAEIRAGFCDRMAFAGVELDAAANRAASGAAEQTIHAGRVPVWIVPTNEELVVARQTLEVLTGEKASGHEAR